MKKLNQYQRAKMNKILLVIAVILIIIAIIVGIMFYRTKSEDKMISQDFRDRISSKNFFDAITIDLSTKEVKRDGMATTLKEEFGISDDEVLSILYSNDELNNYFAGTTIEVSTAQNKVYLKDKYQTKTLIVQADEMKDNFDATDEINVFEGLYILKYDTEKRTKAALEYLQNESWVNGIEPDEVYKIDPLEDISQTVYGENDKAETENTHGISAMGFKNYKKIINDNGSTQEIVVATIGYGAPIDNKYFENRINEEYYNYIDETETIKETIPQGTRILEVIKEATTDNVKIMPLVVINAENYTTTASIVRALSHATEIADVICYEFLQEENEIIKLALKHAFESEVPISCVATNGTNTAFPANDETTISVSSVGKDLKPTEYAATGAYLDFVASSTDVKEIFDSSSSVSRWSGAEYANAHIASAIALIKTYNADWKIAEVYEFIKNFCEDLGEKGKDPNYGHGFVNFSKLKISDIDKQRPVLEEVTVDDTKWEKAKKILIKASDNIKIYGWAITNSEEVPKEWSRSANVQNAVKITEEVNENGTYYIWIVDTAGNPDRKNITISKIDKVAPTIKYTVDTSTAETEKYVMINITATDDGSGLNDLPYSWDGANWGSNNTSLKVTKNGDYKVYVRDAQGNIAEQEVKINSLPEKGNAEIDVGFIIKDVSVSDKWEGDTNKEVTITFNNNLNIKRKKITEQDVMPEEFRPQQGEIEVTNNDTENVIFEGVDAITNTIETQPTLIPTLTPTPIISTTDDELQGFMNYTMTTSLVANKKYYIWVEDYSGNITSQGFTIRKTNNASVTNNESLNTNVVNNVQNDATNATNTTKVTTEKNETNSNKTTNTTKNQVRETTVTLQ